MEHWLHFNNTAKVAEQLLKMTTLAVNERFEQDAFAIIHQLWDALHDYRLVLRQADGSFSSNEAIDMSLQHLLHCTREAVGILTPDSQLELDQAVSLALPTA